MKKIVTLAIAAMMLAQTAAGAANFTDMPQDPQAANAIENAVANGLLSGYEDSTVRPDNNITRGEMAAIITRACKVTNEGDISRFIDVAQGDWYYSPIAKAYEMGAFSGDGQYMHPKSNITFQECFTVLSQVFDILPPYVLTSAAPDPLPENTILQGRRVYDISSLAQFTDSAEVAEWAKIFVAGVVSCGGWSGVDGKITPTAYITRSQFAMVMDNLIKNYIDEPGTYNELPAGNTMIRCDGVILNGVTMNDNLYIGDSVSPNGVTLEAIKANNKLVIRGCATPIIADEVGNKTFGDVGITVSGHVEALRVIRPYINVDMSNATYGTLYTIPDTNLTVTAQN